MRSIFPIFLGMLLIMRRHIQASVEIDNALIGVPEIDCHADTIEMRFRTKRKFTGKIYVQGHADNPDCRVDYGRTTPTGEPVGGIRLHHGTCDMNRRRKGVEGMEFSTVLVISFHPIFVTKTDRAFNINCMYRETAKSVNAGLTVSPIEADQVAYDMPLPQCTYTIRKDELDGPILHYAKVGEQVVHRWECNSDVYGMLVHTCYVEDGQGEKQLVIDERGCHVDRIALGDPTYVTALNMAYRESNVFKFADRGGVRFSCEIKLCVKEHGGCKGITPPICNDFQHDVTGNGISEHYVPSQDDAAGNIGVNTTAETIPESAAYYEQPSAKFKRHAENSSDDIFLNAITQRPNSRSRSKLRTPVATDLISQYVYVLDTIDDSSDAELLQGRLHDDVATGLDSSTAAATVKRLRFASPPFTTASVKSWGLTGSNVCLSTRTFAAMAVAVGASMAAATVVILHLIFRQIRTTKHLKTIEASTVAPVQQISPANFVFK